MSDKALNYDLIRGRVLKRYDEFRKIRARVGRLAVYFVFVSVAASLTTGAAVRENPLFGYMVHNEAQVYVNNGPGGTGEIFTYPAYDHFIAYPLVGTILGLAIGLVFLYGVSVFLAYLRERRIQHEISKEIELEKIRLNIMYTRERQRGQRQPITESIADSLHFPAEKTKRQVELSDEGELIIDDDLLPTEDQSDLRRANGARRG